MKTWTHNQLVRRMAAWLKNTKRCLIVISELHTRTSETPDNIGFVGGGGSILVECKTSRADFASDAGKSFRRDEEQGMGDYRYFAAPAGIIAPHEIPAGWGLLEVNEHQVR